MCGVVGLMAGRGTSLIADVDRMSTCIAHRGPDDRGRWVDPDAGLALGHRRLSIIDLSPAGHQPMTSADGRWVLVLNGEIYDHGDHRRRLELGGLRLRGHSDTEVLLELIAADGPEAALSKVDGMFALGVWDRRDRVLLLARDRMGEKPMYYGQVGAAFAFASELSAIRELPGASSQPSHDALTAYLRRGFVPAPMSIVPGVKKLPPGCVVRVSARGVAGEPIPYWSLEEVAARGVENPVALGDAELVRLADELLRESVERRLIADVPVGAFLSGGVDSSTIVALAQAVSPVPIRTFTVAVGGEADESGPAALVAHHLGTDHTTLPLPDFDALDLTRRVAHLYDEPFADPSAIPTALLCAAARQHVKVALSGDGADELLGGYNRHLVGQGMLSRLLSLPRPVRRGMSAGLYAVPSSRWDRLARALPGDIPGAGTKAHKLAEALSGDDAWDAYTILSTQWDPAQLLPPMAAAPYRDIVLDRRRTGGGEFADILLADQLTTLPDDMLVKVDRASMAVGLEVRVPFLSHKFVEFAWRLPESAKYRDRQGKWLERQILAQYVPQALWDRPKVGFDPPLADWLRGPLREWAHDLLSPDRLQRQGLLEPGPISQALADHDSGRRNRDYALWTVLMLQSWLEVNCP